METALLGIALPQVFQNVKEMLIRQGFLVQTMPTANPVLVAYYEGSWYRKTKQLILELSSLEKEVTRVDITAIINGKKVKREEEEILEEEFAVALHEKFTKAIKHNGYR